MSTKAEPPPAPLPFHELLDALTLGLAVHGDETDPVISGDKALAGGDNHKAAECYQSVQDMSDDTSCKLGYALLQLDRVADARQHLIKEYCCATSNGTAILAFVGPPGQKNEALQLAISMEQPGAYAKVVYLLSGDIWKDREFSLQLAESAIAEYQRFDLLAIRGRLLFSLERAAEVDYEQLLANGLRHPGCAATALEISISTGNVQAGLRAIDLLLANNGGSSNADLEAAILRTQLYLVDGGKTFKPESIQAARNHLKAALALGLGTQTHGNLATVFDLQLRLHEGDETGAQELAEELGARLLLDENSTGLSDDMILVRLSPYWNMVTPSIILDVEHVSSIAVDNGAWEHAVAVEKFMQSEEPEPEDQDALVDAVLTRPVATWLYGPAIKAMIQRERSDLPTLGRWLVANARAFGEYAEFPSEVQSIPASDLVELATHLLSASAPASNDEQTIGDIAPHWLIKAIVDQGRPDLAVNLAEVSHAGLKSKDSSFSPASAALAFSWTCSASLASSGAAFRPR